MRDGQTDAGKGGTGQGEWTAVHAVPDVGERMEKIGEIRAAFSSCETEALGALIERFREDTRSGVQTEIRRAQKRLEALEKESSAPGG